MGEALLHVVYLIFFILMQFIRLGNLMITEWYNIEAPLHVCVYSYSPSLNLIKINIGSGLLNKFKIYSGRGKGEGERERRAGEGQEIEAEKLKKSSIIL